MAYIAFGAVRPQTPNRPSMPVVDRALVQPVPVEQNRVTDRAISRRERVALQAVTFRMANEGMPHGRIAVVLGLPVLAVGALLKAEALRRGNIVAQGRHIAKPQSSFRWSPVAAPRDDGPYGTYEEAVARIRRAFPPTTYPKMRDIIVVAAHMCDVRVPCLLSRRRDARVTRARQIAMWLCRRFTVQSLPAIGAVLGGRDHTTVLHGCRAVDRRIAGLPMPENSEDCLAWARALVAVDWPSSSARGSI